MLVKIKGAGGAWTLFDQAEQVSFSTELKEYHSHNDFVELLPSNAAQLVFVLPGLDLADLATYPIQAALISFSRMGKEHVVLFNQIAYICNDSGKTVEKVELGR